MSFPVTGAISGERPWSWIKITFFSIAILAGLGLISYFKEYYQ